MSKEPIDDSIEASCVQKMREQARRIEALEALCREMAEALEYHQEQTRPIHKTQEAITKYKEVCK